MTLKSVRLSRRREPMRFEKNSCIHLKTKRTFQTIFSLLVKFRPNSSKLVIEFAILLRVLAFGHLRVLR